MTFHKTPSPMYFTFDESNDQYKPVNLSKLPQEATIYEASYTKHEEEPLNLSVEHFKMVDDKYRVNPDYEASYTLNLSLGYFKKVDDKYRVNPEYAARFNRFPRIDIKYFFYSRQVYSNQNWSELPHTRIVAFDDRVLQCCIDFKEPLSEACPLLPTPDPKALNNLLTCIDDARLINSIIVNNGNTSNKSTQTNQIGSEQEQRKTISMQVLSGFIAAIGIAAIAVAFAVLANPVVVGIVAGIGTIAVLASGYLFFKNHSAQPATFDSCCEQAISCT